MDPALKRPICSILTAQAPAGLAALLIAGEGAERVLLRAFRRPRRKDLPRAGRAAYGLIFRDSGGPPSVGAPMSEAERDAVDEVLVVRTAPPPAECFEIFCHGGAAAARGLAEVFVDMGARELPWTRLLQRGTLAHDCAAALLAAEGREQAAVLAHLMAGTLEAFFRALLEALVDSRAGGAAARGAAERAAVEALESFQRGRFLRQPPVVVLTGRPNAGKSTLFNAILGEDRALTSPFPGTTRDPVDATFLLIGFPVRLVDTAGDLGAGSGPGRAESVDRRARSAARALAARADAEIRIEDATAPDDGMLKRADGGFGAGRRVVIKAANKCDLLGDSARAAIVFRPQAEMGRDTPVIVSALSGEGVDILLAALDAALGLPLLRRSTGAVLFHRRQVDLTARALSALRLAQDPRRAIGAIKRYLARPRAGTGLVPA